MSRHAACKLPVSNRPKRTPLSPITNWPKKSPISNQPRRIPVSIPISTSVGIIVQVQKVSADVSQLQKNLAIESAARNELQMCVEQLKTETAEAKQYFTQDARNVRLRNGAVTQHLMKTLPCKSLIELDCLLAYISNKSLQWVEYVKLLGGTDFNSAIKIIIYAIMDRSVQKQLSWTGVQTKKPSLKHKYKGILDGIHVAMKESFKDYTISQGEVKMHSLLKNAAKCQA